MSRNTLLSPSNTKSWNFLDGLFQDIIMANQRQGLFFRLPWLTSSSVPRSTQPRNTRGGAGSPAPVNQTSSVLPQKPPFRPAGVAPSQPPPSQSQPKPGSQAPSPTHDAKEKVSSRPSSPYLAANSVQTPTQQLSPSQTQKKSRASSLPPSPSIGSSRSGRHSVPPSPSPAASQSEKSIQPAEQTQASSVLLSPSEKLELAPQGTSLLLPSSGNHLPASPKNTKEPALWEGIAPDSVSPSKISSLPKSSEHQPILNSEEKHEKAYEKNTKEPALWEGIAPDSVSPSKISSLPKSSEHQPILNSEEKHEKAYEKIKGVQEEHRREENKHPIYEEQTRIITMQENFEENSGKLLGSSQQKDISRESEALQKHAKPKGAGVSLHKNINEDISKLIYKMETGLNQSVNDKPVSIITLAGDNRGASMQLDSDPSKKERSVHINRGYKVNPDDSAEATTDGEGTSKRPKSRNPIAEEDQANTVVNSNIQGINNSMVFNSSVTERDPGIHLSRVPDEPAKIKGERELRESHKAEVNVMPPEKHTYEPRVRRRCLRGLFMEPNDSEPEKPQRHGCRYSNCGVKNKDDAISALM